MAARKRAPSRPLSSRPRRTCHSPHRTSATPSTPCFSRSMASPSDTWFPVDVLAPSHRRAARDWGSLLSHLQLRELHLTWVRRPSRALYPAAVTGRRRIVLPVAADRRRERTALERAGCRRGGFQASSGLSPRPVLSSRCG